MRVDETSFLLSRGLRVAPVNFSRPASGSASLPPDLELGQLIRGRVLGAPAEGKVLLEIQGHTIMAETRVPLKPGDQVWMEVKQTEPFVWLHLAEKKGELKELIRFLLANSPLLGQTLEALSQGMGGPGVQTGPGKDLAWLFGFIPETAVDEKGDLPALLKMIAAMHQGVGKEDAGAGLFRQQLSELMAGRGESLLSAEKGAGLTKLAQFLDAVISFNSQPPQDATQPCYIFPMWFANGEGWGEWLFGLDSEARGEGETPGYVLTFWLNMTHLGEVHIALRVREAAIDGVFSMGSEETSAHMRACLPELQAILKDLGFSSTQLSCRHVPAPLMPQFLQELKDRGQLFGSSLVNVTV